MSRVVSCVLVLVRSARALCLPARGRVMLVHIETIKSPVLYSKAQIELACEIATALNRGKLILCLKPEKP